jgi:hypothetical protein
MENEIVFSKAESSNQEEDAVPQDGNIESSENYDSSDNLFAETGPLLKVGNLKFDERTWSCISSGLVIPF